MRSIYVPIYIVYTVRWVKFQQSISITSTRIYPRLTSVCSHGCTSPIIENVGVISSCLIKSLKRKDLALHLVSSGLVAVGATLSVYVNPIALSATGLGMVLHALAKKKNYPKKVETCRFTYTSYQKELNSLRGYLRGNEFSEPLLLFELGRLGDTSPICVLSFQIN